MSVVEFVEAGGFGVSFNDSFVDIDVSISLLLRRYLFFIWGHSFAADSLEVLLCYLEEGRMFGGEVSLFLFVFGAGCSEPRTTYTQKIMDYLLQGVEVEENPLVVVEKGDAQGPQDVAELDTGMAWEETDGLPELYQHVTGAEGDLLNESTHTTHTCEGLHKFVLGLLVHSLMITGGGGNVKGYSWVFFGKYLTFFHKMWIFFLTKR